jgi:hypothetical protein
VITTLKIPALDAAVVVPLVTARPTLIGSDIVTVVAVPIGAQFVPSEEAKDRRDVMIPKP